MPSYHVDVDLGPDSYRIDIEAGVLRRAGPAILPHLQAKRCLIIADDQVAAVYGEALQHSLESVDVHCTLHRFPAGEAHKDLERIEAMWQACAEARIDRSSTVIALGGGVSGDMAGFVAATWMRGVRFIQIPTSLLAMVDSSVGGKTGINCAAGKNLIGAFKQPDYVLIDPELVTSMPAREFRAGLAEICKYGVIYDAVFFAEQEAHAEALRDGDAERVAHAIQRSCQIKAIHVSADQYEHGMRSMLNYGHTFGHALERLTGYRQYLHGEAVAIGMHMAAHAAAALGMLDDQKLLERQAALLQRYQLPISHGCGDIEATIDTLVDYCRLDKKVRAGTTRFVLPSKLGTVELVTGPASDAIRAGFRAGLHAADIAQ